MGFFSWDCVRCGKSIRSPYAVDRHTGWMADAIVITHDGCLLKGEYDGYGRVGSYEIDIDCCHEPCMYHKKCWEELGKPMDYKPSNSAADQGYFVDDLEAPEPTKDDLWASCFSSVSDYEDFIIKKMMAGSSVDDVHGELDALLAQKQSADKNS